MAKIIDGSGASAARGFLTRMRGGGRCPRRHPVADVLRSWVASFVGIFVAALPSTYLHLGPVATIGLIGSFGASAVLLYGLPRAELAQPRNVVGGHVVSALVGVATFAVMGDGPVAAGCAVASAVAAMHITRTLHPPGGATALTAVIGGPTVHRLGLTYVAAPVLVGVLILVSVALLANNLTHDTRRNYPVYWW